jgi:erythromycin esterase
VTGPTDVWPIDPSTPDAARTTLDGHAELFADAAVVGIGVTARTVRELQIVAHGLVRLLVESGCSSVLIEGDRDASSALDAFVTHGVGDPEATLRRSRPFLATRELLDLVLWLRRHNERDRSRAVRLVHGGADDLSSPAALERSLADEVIAWREHTGHRIVYLGGAAHTAVVGERVVSPAPTEPTPSAGYLLCQHFAMGYRSTGLTFGSGPIPQPVPPPPPESLEARLDHLPYPTALVATPAWCLHGARTLRIVGPGYAPSADSRHVMTGDLTGWFDIVVHHKAATSVNFLA